jgi:DNA segregation ATPase FtsK/SpoIIIE, S-DNA-T family
VLGIEHDGRPLLLHLPSPDVAHVLMSGSTGSGKTELARSMIASLIRLNRPAHLQLVLIDPKNRGFAPFQQARHLLRPIVTEPTEAIAVLGELVEEMIRRDQEDRSEPHIVVFIDELTDLALTAPKEVQTLLTRLVQRGRQAGLHVVACTQKPTAEVIGSLVKASFPVRLVGAVPSPEDAKVATGLARTGAEKLLGRGDFLAVVRGEIIRFQSAFISEREIVSLLSGAPPIVSLPVKATGVNDRPALPQRMLNSLRRVK